MQECRPLLMKSTLPNDDRGVAIRRKDSWVPSEHSSEVGDEASSAGFAGKYHSTYRKLENRHVQLIGISGVIGTALFVSIGKALYRGGSVSLLLGFALWCVPILCITVSTAEMVCYLPLNSPFLRLASRCVNDSLTVMAGWNFWFLECVQIPFEIVAVNSIIHYWRDDYSAAITLVVQVMLYLLISLFAVRYYGEIEFWLASFKVLLAVGLFCFTFVTMVGGNPKRDRYGFRYIGEAPFKQYSPTMEPISSSAGYFQGFLACLIQASFTIAGPDYVSMIAGETKLPRKVLPVAFKQVFIRLTVLFLGGCLCVGIVCSANDPDLTAAINASRPGAGSSPYVIAMNHLGIKILPDIVNAALVTAAFSAGNAYTYCSSRSLYGLALDGYAPAIFKRCNRFGVPIYAVSVSVMWSVLSLLQLNSNSAVVLNWLISLITASQLINFGVLCVVYLYFRRAYLAQQDNLPELPFKSWWQPYTAYVGLTCVLLIVVVQGYTVFYSALWNVKDFLFCYLMVFIDIAIYLGYRYIWRRGKDAVIPPTEVDLTTGLLEIELHERHHGFERYSFFHVDD
ncbi:AAR038Wp [Eremothecium gossypii ATCC 10895]|uniref:AAR038Wp n=1 Tax=Eremothecium gossypii (strain ATCC 10895 / CBS 109.51 / FGSC 9923 / NRRL Y-1056) TaxID=284811 RepID=Q75EP1_EREGS|nr:AAR038Wp [Eremothecium gossypii ATCC 10895]AAS50403.2 AAR038Wp [Eremothecium gossypii ATCC 10895]AEY94689.1 FAAR038Wp [Eremothecium gossypii FDAG1]